MTEICSEMGTRHTLTIFWQRYHKLDATPILAQVHSREQCGCPENRKMDCRIDMSKSYVGATYEGNM